MNSDQDHLFALLSSPLSSAFNGPIPTTGVLFPSSALPTDQSLPTIANVSDWRERAECTQFLDYLCCCGIDSLRMSMSNIIFYLHFNNHP